MLSFVAPGSSGFPWRSLAFCLRLLVAWPVPLWFPVTGTAQVANDIWVVFFLLVLGAYTLHTCLRERPRNASATARGAYARTLVPCRAYADAYARKLRAAFFQLGLCNAKSIVV